jgi:hypothetical protein
MDPEYIALTETEGAKGPRRRYYTAVALPDTLADGVDPFSLSEFPQLGINGRWSMFLYQADHTISAYSNRFTEKWAKHCILTGLGEAYYADTQDRAIDRFDTFGTYADMLNFLAETLEERNAKANARSKTCLWVLFSILVFGFIISGFIYYMANKR